MTNTNTKVEVVIKRVIDIDEFASDPPFAKLTHLSNGEQQATAQGRRIKGSDTNFSYDKDNDSNKLTFYVTEGKSSDFSVSILSQDKTANQTVCYQGVGKLSIPTVAPSSDVDVTCQLLEDGDPNLEDGQVVFSYSVFIEEQPSASLSAQSSPQKKSASSAVSSPDKQRLAAQQMAEEAALDAQIDAEMERYMSDSALPTVNLEQEEEEDAPFAELEPLKPVKKSKVPPVNLSATMPVTSSTEKPKGNVNLNSTTNNSRISVKEAKAEIIRRASNAAMGNSNSNSNSLANLATAGGKSKNTSKSKETAQTMLSVLKEPNTNANQPVYELVKAEVSSGKEEAQYRRITVKVHQVSVTGVQGAAGSAVLKISVAPLPGNVTVFRSVSSSSSGPQGSVSYDFGLKTAALSMGVGDLRSKLFKQGAVPRLQLEVTLNDTVYALETALYLPALLRNHSNELLTVPLQLLGVTASAGGSYIVFELNGDSSASNKLSASGNSNSPASYNVRSSYGAAQVSLWMLGVTGSDLKAYPDLKTQAVLTASLCCSSNGDGRSLSAVSAKSFSLADSTGFSGSLFTFPDSWSSVTLSSQWPAADVLEVKLSIGAFSDDELGRVYIPVAALQELSGKHPEYSQVPLAYNAYRKENDSFVLCKWQLICVAACSDVTPASGVVGKMLTLTSPPRESALFDLQKTGAFSPGSTGNNSGNNTGNNTLRIDPQNGSQPLRANNNTWMSGDVRDSVNVGGTNRSVPTLNTNTVSTVKSVSGQLVCCAQGLLVRRPGDNTASSSPASLSQSTRLDSLCLETSLLPEGVRKSTGSSAVAVCAISSSDILSSVEWGGTSRTLTFDVAWALQQNQVSCLRLNVVHSVRRVILGTAILDLSSVVTAATASSGANSSSGWQCIVPVRNVSTAPSSATVANCGYAKDGCTSVLEDKDVVGWIIMGVKFHSNGTSSSAANAGLELACKATWSRFTAYPSQYYLGLLGTNNHNLTPAAVQANSGNKMEQLSVHVALSTLTITSHSSLLVEHSDDSESALHLCLRLGNCLSSAAGRGAHWEDSVVATAILVNNSVVWNGASDVVVNLTAEESLNSFAFLYLVGKTQLEEERPQPPSMLNTQTNRSASNTANSKQFSTMFSTLNEDQTRSVNSRLSPGMAVLGECNLLLINSLLQKGVPANYTLPFRDSAGGRVATLALSVQSTSTVGEDPISTQIEEIYNRTNSPQFDSSNAIYSSASSAGKSALRVDFIEGNVADSSAWKSSLQPFFECTVHHTSNSNSANPQTRVQARTGFLTLNPDDLVKGAKDWAINCELVLPAEDLLSVAQNVSSVAGYTLHVVCRDASKQHCPIIGTARIAVPYAVIGRLAPLEQFITLTPPPTTVAAPVVGVRTTYSRVKIRLTPFVKEGEYGDVGMGSVVYRLLGVSESSTDGGTASLDAIVTATATAYALDGTTAASGSANVDNSDQYCEDRVFSSGDAAFTTFQHAFAMFNENSVLSGQLPVPGGLCDVALSVRPFTSNTSLTTSFPVLSTLTKLIGDDPALPTVPRFELSLSKPTVSHQGRSAAGSMSSSASNRVPRVFMEAVYVPYVTGRLVVECTEVKVFSDSSLLSGGLPTSKDVAVRYVLGGESRGFNYSEVIRTAGDRPLQGLSRQRTGMTGSSSISILGSTDGASRPAGRNLKKSQSNTAHNLSALRTTRPLQPDTFTAVAGSSSSVTVLRVNTYDLLHGAQNVTDADQFRGLVSMVPLFLTVLDLDPATAAEAQLHPTLGIGCVHTATLYYQAMRAAASSSLHTPSSSATGGVAATDIGASPLLVTSVNIYDPKTKQTTGSVGLRIRFIAETVPVSIIRAIRDSLVSSNSQDIGHDSARIELGLKQSFLVADEDKSGSVSAAELLKVIKNAESIRRSKRSSDRSAATIGMENATALLLSLVPSSELSGADNATISEAELVAMVGRIFSRLDVDGDGLVSWWEWKAVLTATMALKGIAADASNGHREASDVYRVNPMDTIVIGISAAHDALASHQIGKTGGVTEAATSGVYPFVSVAGDQSAEGARRGDVYRNTSGSNQALTVSNPFEMGEEATLMDNIGLDLPEGGAGENSRTVKKLHNMIKSLRLTNNILAKRFEKALHSAQKISLNLDGYSPLSGPGVASLTQQDVVRLEQRIHDAEENNNKNLQAFLAAKNRGDLLASQLLELQSASSASQLSDSQHLQSNVQNNNRLKSEIQQHTEKLNRVRSQRMLTMKATVTISMWLKKHVLPYIQRRRKARSASLISHKLTSQIVRKNYKLRRQAELKVISTIQRIARGMLARKKIRELNAQSLKIQAAFRGKMDRDRVNALNHKIALEKAAAMFSKQYRATAVIKRGVLRWLLFTHNKKKAAALRIEQAALKRKERKELEKRREAERLLREKERLAEEERLRKNQAAIAIQLAAREKQRRKEGKALTAQQRIFKKFRSDRAAMVPARNKPESLAASVTDFWVDFTAAQDSPQKTKPGQPPKAKDIGANAHIGRVEGADEVSRILSVKYLETTQASGEQFVTKAIPFDHPQINWYTTYVELPPEPEPPTHSHNRVVYNKTTVPAIKNHPPYLAAAVGYRVEIQSQEEGAEAGDMFTGRVARVDPEKRTVIVAFETLEANTEDVEEYPFDSKAINWVVRPKVERPDYLQGCLGFTVEVRSADDDMIEGDYFVGAVVAIDALEQNVTISYELNPVVLTNGELTPQQKQERKEKKEKKESKLLHIDTAFGHNHPLASESTDTLNSNTTSTSSLRKVSVSKQPQQQPPDLETMSWLNRNITWVVPPLLGRPESLNSVLGYRVEIKSREPDAEVGDMFTGTVVGYNVATECVVVSFDSVEPVEGSDGDDTEHIPFRSPDILWVAPPLSKPVISSRPAVIEDTVGFLVEVQSHEEGAEKGDMFPGVVTNYSKVRDTVFVLFESVVEGEAGDQEEFSFSSPDVDWLHNPRQSNSKYRPAIDQCVGYVVEVPHDSASDAGSVSGGSPRGALPLFGKVTGVNSKTKNLTILFDGDISETIHYSSSDLIWLNPLVMMDSRFMQVAGRLAAPKSLPQQKPPVIQHPIATKMPLSSNITSSSSSSLNTAVTTSPKPTLQSAAKTPLHSPLKASDKSSFAKPDNSHRRASFAEDEDLVTYMETDDKAADRVASPKSPPAATKDEKAESKSQSPEAKVSREDKLSNEEKQETASPQPDSKLQVSISSYSSTNSLSDYKTQTHTPSRLQHQQQLYIEKNGSGGKLAAKARSVAGNGLNSSDVVAFHAISEPDHSPATATANALEVIAASKLRNSTSPNKALSPVTVSPNAPSTPVKSGKNTATTSPVKSPVKSATPSVKTDISSTSAVPRPALEDCTGYHIIVSDEGGEDLHCSVTGFKVAEQCILVRFYDPEGDLDSETEEMPYDMEGLTWFQQKPET